MTRRSARRGLTLLETLAALTLAGVVTAGLTLSIRTGLDAGERIRRDTERHARARAILDALAADVGAAFLSAANTQRTLFVGLPSAAVLAGEPFLVLTTLSYRRAGDAVAPRADAVRVEYALVPEAAGDPAGPRTFALIRRELWLTEAPPGVEETIGTGVLSLELRYHDGVDFRDGWSAEPLPDPPLRAAPDELAPEPALRELPRAVEVALVLAPGGTEAPRLYRTVLPVHSQAPVPFEPEAAGRGGSAGPAGRGE